jgi:hypothetical protein
MSGSSANFPPGLASPISLYIPNGNQIQQPPNSSYQHQQQQQAAIHNSMFKPDLYSSLEYSSLLLRPNAMQPSFEFKNQQQNGSNGNVCSFKSPAFGLGSSSMTELTGGKAASTQAHKS